LLPEFFPVIESTELGRNLPTLPARAGADAIRAAIHRCAGDRTGDLYRARLQGDPVVSPCRRRAGIPAGLKAVVSRRTAGADVVAAVYAGVAAGILATIVQIVLWAIFTDALPAILYRDSRFAAAIVLGRGVLPPPASFDERIMLVATLVHFALAIAYALTLAWLIANLRVRTSLLAGAAFGLGLYAVNMYGFTAVFPWFASSRDWITAVTHLVFGTVLAAVYRVAARARRD
jgi:hypothetical protein